MKTIYLIDTCYLSELYEIPGKSNIQSKTAILQRLKAAIAHGGGSFFVTTGVIYELGNHIAQANTNRRVLASTLFDDVKSSIETSSPWTITPAEALPELLGNLGILVSEHADQKVGLTDTQIIETAKRLKSQFNPPCLVHIWTKDRALKAREPDIEPSPYTG